MTDFIFFGTFSNLLAKRPLQTKHESSAAARQTLPTGVNTLGVDQVGLISVVVPKGVNNDGG